MAEQMILRGCAPEPLIHYLKALGVLRLVAEQFDPGVRAAWRGDAFCLETDRTPDELVAFFMNEYSPTPIVAPWNGSSGFFPKDNQEAINTIANSKEERFADYRRTIAKGREIVGNLAESPKDKDEKAKMLRQARNTFPDRAITYLDAAFVLGTEKPDYSPILGTGGNDGHLEFSNNFMFHLLLVLPQDQNEKKRLKQRELSQMRLRASIFSEGAAILKKAAVGQFHPGGAGGANASQGLGGAPYVNPWDFVLCFEGILILAGAAVRRLASGVSARTAFPFTVRNSAIGYGTAAVEEDVRSEMWLPIWSRMSTYQELLHIFSEGRAQFGEAKQRVVRNGFDFARAVAELGVDRGIDAFQRFGFTRRYGKMFLATSYGRFAVRERPAVSLIYDVDRWLDGLRRATGDAKRTPPRLLQALTDIEEAIYNLCAFGDREYLRQTLIALGAAEAEVARRPRLRDEYNLRPLAGLKLRWVRECDDQSAEFELAAALASITGAGEREPIRANLEPVIVKSGAVSWAENDTSVTWGTGALETNLAAVLHRRSIEARAAAAAHPALSAKRCASLTAIDCFLHYETDDGRIEDLLRGLALIDWQTAQDSFPVNTSREVPPRLPRAYALLKLLFLPDGNLTRNGQSRPVPIKHEPAIIPLLRAGRVTDALEIAGRRLQASGLVPLTDEFHVSQEDGARLAAALLIPIDEPSISALAKLALRDTVDNLSTQEML